MISHALTIVTNELKRHFDDAYAPVGTTEVALGNLAEGIAANGPTGAVKRDTVLFSMVNVREEKTLKNIPNQVRNDAALRVIYENPPVFLNLNVLIVATHSNYATALSWLSRTIRFFQFRNVFDQDSVAPSSLDSALIDPRDKLETFKLILDLYSPTMEEVNHLWGTLGGKQYPFVLYTLRLLELKFKAIQGEGGLITEVISGFRLKAAAS